MPCLNLNYQSARGRMKPGDVLAFGGKGEFSHLIKWATHGPVSHVGVILQSQIRLDKEPTATDKDARFFNLLIESTSLNGFAGVTINRLSERIDAYDGEVFWLPLSDEIRGRLDLKLFYDWLLNTAGREYDTPQALKSAIDILDKIPLIGGLTHNKEDFRKFFCSELVAAGLEVAGAVGSLNASEVTPMNLCQFNIYQPDYYRLKGDPDKRIKNFNRLNPEGWGE